jgi:hypothetical protein
LRIDWRLEVLAARASLPLKITEGPWTIRSNGEVRLFKRTSWASASYEYLLTFKIHWDVSFHVINAFWKVSATYTVHVFLEMSFWY